MKDVNDVYQTLANDGKGIYKEKGSKFLGFAFSIKSEEEFKEHLNNLKKNYYDARHHCYAFIIGHQHDKYRASDDGEPNNSAGMPILGQIRSRGLTNTMVVVVRYFGGTKLGVSGLIHAYKTAASEALENAGSQEKIITDTLMIRFEYPQMHEVMRVGKDYQLNMGNQSFKERCQIEFEVRKKWSEEVAEKLRKIRGVELEIK